MVPVLPTPISVSKPESSFVEYQDVALAAQRNSIPMASTISREWLSPIRVIIVPSEPFGFGIF